MLIVFPLFYITISSVNIIRYFKLRHDKERIYQIHRSVNTVNIVLMIWCLLFLIGYFLTSYIVQGILVAPADIEIDVWFFAPLVVTIILLLFKKIRRAVFAWIFFTACITTGWILFITFIQLSLS